MEEETKLKCGLFIAHQGAFRAEKPMCFTLFSLMSQGFLTLVNTAYVCPVSIYMHRNMTCKTYLVMLGITTQFEKLSAL